MTQPALFDVGPKVPPIARTFATPDRPGSGPEGQCCGTCLHFRRTGNSEGRGQKHFKCFKVRHLWTHGPATDIRFRWPACSQWESAQFAGLVPPGWPKDSLETPEGRGIAMDYHIEQGNEALADVLRKHLGQAAAAAVDKGDAK